MSQDEAPGGMAGATTFMSGNRLAPVDSLDCAILRGLYRNHALDFQGIDPRRSAAEIAEYAGVSRNSIAHRMEAWTTSGFLFRTSVFPNPDLFGLSFGGQFFQVLGAGGVPQMEDRLRLSGVALVYEAGAISYGDTLVGGIWPTRSGQPFGIGSDPEESKPDRRPISKPFPVVFPASTAIPHATDWRIVREVRSNPDNSRRVSAERIGTSARNFLRRLDTLLDGSCIFYLPHLDFTRGRGTVLLLTVVSPWGAGTDAVRAAVTESFPDRLPVQPVAMSQHLFPAPEGGPELDSTEFLLPVQTAQAGLNIAKQVKEFDGVLDLIVTFPIKNYEEPAAFDHLLVDHH
ncbi:MAG: hypothetical protein L3K23_10630 [Thermoplasmata archaeon]|nr:hypothetical protein [Thermoplasmata archaeon]